MSEAWELVEEYILPFFEFLKKVINAIRKFLNMPTIA